MRARIRGVRLANQISQHWRDLLIIFILAAMAGFASYQGARLIDPAVFDWDALNAWFEGDPPRVYRNMIDRGSDHFRNKVHPLFSLLTFPPVFLLMKGLHLEPITATRIAIAAVAFLWMSSLFVILRLIGCQRFDATLFSILAAASAAAVFWFVIPETYSFGSLSILLALGLVALAQYRHLSPLWYVAISALTLSFTTTNWMAGIIATFVEHPWKRFWSITVNTFCVVVVLWSVQKFFFPSAEFFLVIRGGEGHYLLRPESGGLLQVAKSLILHSMIMPAIEIVNKYPRPDWPIMSIQNSFPGSGSLWGAIAVGLWIVLLSLGLWGFVSMRKSFQFRLALGLILIGQLTLHTVYGEETFLYTLHFGPLLVILTAMGTLTRARPVVLIVAGALILSAGFNNVLQFRQAREFFHHHGTPRHQVQVQMQLRPTDPWPRGTGHVVLAVPGSHEVEKAYHEPGGSFSPAVGSFGVSVWVTDKEGRLMTTSDNVPLDKIHQKLVWTDGQNMPGILTETGYYHTLWSSAEPGRWLLSLKTPANVNTKPMVVIRSVGPAGGAIQSLKWNNQQLLINNRWSVRIDPPPVEVSLGEEGVRGWKTEHTALQQWKSDRGWGYVRFGLADGSDWHLHIQDSTSVRTKLSHAQTRPALELDLPDEQFTASLNAQVAHLMMSLVGRQTRPGEPTHYPLSCHREGAYIIVALARAGRLDEASELSIYMAENDFFGGFGPEADAPGLAIWALEEVAVKVNQREYDQWLWPHVRRKAEFILKMLSTDEPIRQPATGLILPELREHPDLNLVAEPARDGLIIGRMNNHRPLLHVNAVSYRGLLEAASLADRIDQPAVAKRWRAEAMELQQAWKKAFQPPESNNPRTYISGLWPTWVATGSSDVFLQGLQERWSQLRDTQGRFRDIPLLTYFEVAEAHQWLFLNQRDRVWKTLRWFWDHQASPGLYTWWEGKGEENSFHRWERVRGWVNPPHVTPHYWTAAEMLLLQLDMLAYISHVANDPTLVIGAGVPTTWLDHPLRVQGLHTPHGQVDWNWDTKQVHVKIHDSKVKVQLGSVFPQKTKLHVEYLPFR